MRMGELFEKDIDINADASDVICRDNKGFINRMTGKRGKDLDEVIRDRRFLYFGSDSGPIYGYYIYTEENALMGIRAYFNKKRLRWDIDKRAFAMVGDQFTATGTTWQDCVDICGQAFIRGECANLAAGSMEKARSFFGEVGYLRNRGCDVMHPLSFDKIQDVEAICLNMSEKQMMVIDKTWLYLKDRRMLRKQNNDFVVRNYTFDNGRLLDAKLDCSFNADLGKEKDDEDPMFYIPTGVMEMPKEAFPAVERMKQLYIESLCHSVSYKADRFSILQKHKAGLILRQFLLVLNCRYPAHESTVDVMEYNRCLIRNDVMFERRETASKIIWCDDLKGTTFEFSSKQLQKEVKDIWNFADNEYIQKTKETVWKGMYNSDLYDYDKGLTNRALILMCALSIPCFEKVFNAASKRTKEILMSRLMEEMYGDMSAEIYANNILRTIFGPINKDGNTPAEIIGIPKGMMCLFTEEASLGNLKTVKTMFQTDEAKAYFMRMNEQDCKDLKEKIENTNSERQLSTIARMSKVFGHKNYKKYFEFTNSILYDYFAQYADFIKELEFHLDFDDKELKKIVETFHYNMDEKELANGIAAFEILCKSEDYTYDDMCEIFNESQDEWERFSFEKDDFLIVWPKKPEDVVYEGMKLKHCARTFLGAIADGRTDLLFIRKKEKPDEPFYTIEVKNSELRQAHGFDNRNILENKEALDFLVNFCKEKNLAFSPKKSTELLGADG